MLFRQKALNFPLNDPENPLGIQLRLDGMAVFKGHTHLGVDGFHQSVQLFAGSRRTSMLVNGPETVFTAAYAALIHGIFIIAPFQRIAENSRFERVWING